MVTVTTADYIIYTPLLIIDNNWAKCLHNRKNIRIFALRKVRNHPKIQSEGCKLREQCLDVAC